MIYSLWGFFQKSARTNFFSSFFFSGGHPRRFEVTLKSHNSLFLFFSLLGNGSITNNISKSFSYTYEIGARKCRHFKDNRYSLHIKVTVYLQGCLAYKRCSASDLSCRYLNSYIKLKLIELAIKLYQ